MKLRIGNKKEMPDVPKMDVMDALAEVWSQINFAAYHLAYVQVYSQSEALRTNMAVLRDQDQHVRNHAQVDLLICRSHLGAFFWHAEHVFEALRTAIARRKKEYPDDEFLPLFENGLEEAEQMPIRQEIRDYRNMGHQTPGIIGCKWDKDGAFLHHFLPTISGHQQKEDVEMNARLIGYFEFVANAWLAFIPEALKGTFPKDFCFPVTVPNFFTGELPAELKKIPRLEITIQSYRKKEAHEP